MENALGGMARTHDQIGFANPDVGAQILVNALVVLCD